MFKHETLIFIRALIMPFQPIQAEKHAHSLALNCIVMHDITQMAVSP